MRTLSFTPMIYIDIENQINNSNSALLKGLPRIVKKALAKFIRQDEINRILNKYSDTEGIEFLSAVLNELDITIEAEGLENLPENGKCFFVANHPFGFVDGLILTYLVGTKYGEFRAIGNELFNLIPQLKSSVVLVNVFGKSSKEYLLEIDRIFKSDLPVTHFPAGKVSRLEKWKVSDIPWHKSFISKSGSCERHVVPIYFAGRNSVLFYSVYLIRKLLGIKVNLELSLLPHEIFNKKHRTIRVKIGKPIAYPTFDHSKSAQDWAQEVRNLVYGQRD
jgi:putative hemolysin